ncbi:hypothetical protein DSO57_1008769 [Entomophthora muscae]|uniref:Uncharacterized protein n=1 Tax=Entomophthora muscae TaxID=34485 RepID=A0ACC2UH56_9FUNG|nr:hypothetical protein DSO57_1008769 [Entomophthora muscae]
MAEKSKRPLTSIFRLPKIPIKNILKSDTKGFNSYTLSKQDKSWEAKDASGCQLFWVELDRESKTGSLAELLGIFGEQIAFLRRESPTSKNFRLMFAESPDAPEYESISVSVVGEGDSRSTRMTLVTKDSKSTTEFNWESTKPQCWKLCASGDSKNRGLFERLSEEKAAFSFPQLTSPEEVAIFTFAIAYSIFS